MFIIISKSSVLIIGVRFLQISFVGRAPPQLIMFPWQVQVYCFSCRRLIAFIVPFTSPSLKNLWIGSRGEIMCGSKHTKNKINEDTWSHRFKLTFQIIVSNLSFEITFYSVSMFQHDCNYCSKTWFNILRITCSDSLFQTICVNQCSASPSGTAQTVQVSGLPGFSTPQPLSIARRYLFEGVN